MTSTPGPERFAVFILTHGRPDSVLTYETLQRQGYTGPLYLIVDNEDAALPAYQRRFGEQVIVFDKAAVAAQLDEGDNFSDRRAVLYARNASFQIAAALGLDYFLQLDDDYRYFFHQFTASLRYAQRLVKNLDRLFASVLAYYKGTQALTIALAQTGDLVGGQQGSAVVTVRTKRKAMNAFFCSTARPFQFVGRVNEDVNTYISLGNRGGLFLTVYNATLQQRHTQAQPGGMTELYEAQGTYPKSFYSVMYAPSCVVVSHLLTRLHHRVRWEQAVPLILSEEHRKPSAAREAPAAAPQAPAQGA